jgi:hypothetical protein
MHIDEIDTQWSNAPVPREESSEFPAKLTADSFTHPLKHRGRSTLTAEGTQIDDSDEQQLNANFSMHTR